MNSVSEQKVSISACLIVKNEARHLARCLQSLQGLVQDIWIADTGSSDNTIAIAKQFTPHVWSVPWNWHFSQARNESIATAPGEWILILDADEWLPDSTRSAIPQLLLSAAFEGPCILQALVGSPNQAMTLKRFLFRNHCGIRFCGRVHESLYSERVLVKSFDCYPLIVWHEPVSPSVLQDKASGYLALIREELAESELPSQRRLELLFHAGREFLRLQQDEAAHRSFSAAWQIQAQRPWTTFAFYLGAALCQSALGQMDYLLAQSIASKLVLQEPDRTEGSYYLAWAELALGYIEAALGAIERAEGCISQQRTFSSESPQQLQWNLKLLRYRCWLLQGQPAHDPLEQMYRQRPTDFMAVLVAYAFFLSGEHLLAGQWLKLSGRFSQESTSNQNFEELVRLTCWLPAEVQHLRHSHRVMSER